jgi:hypothetical protein
MPAACVVSEKTEPCALCGATAVEVVQCVDDWPRAEGGVFERREWSCAACGEAYTDDEQGRANAEAERAAGRRGDDWLLAWAHDASTVMRVRLSPRFSLKPALRAQGDVGRDESSADRPG